MEKEQEQKEKYSVTDIAKYRPMALAPEFLKAKDMGTLEETIVNFFEKGLGVKNKGDIEAAVKPYMTNQNALQSFIGNFVGRYNESLYSQKIEDLRELYDSSFKKYFTEDNLAKVDEVFSSEDTYESILNKYAKAAEIAKSETGNFTDEQKKKAEKTIQQLNKILMPLQAFEAGKIDDLRKPITEKVLRKSLNALYEEKKEDKK